MIDETEIAAIRARRETAFRVVCDVAARGDRAWRMSVPAHPTDSDLCITASLDDIPALLTALAAVTAERDRLRLGVEQARALLRAIDQILLPRGAAFQVEAGVELTEELLGITGAEGA